MLYSFEEIRLELLCGVWCGEVQVVVSVGVGGLEEVSRVWESTGLVLECDEYDLVVTGGGEWWWGWMMNSYRVIAVDIKWLMSCRPGCSKLSVMTRKWRVSIG